MEASGAEGGSRRTNAGPTEGLALDRQVSRRSPTEEDQHNNNGTAGPRLYRRSVRGSRLQPCRRRSTHSATRAAATNVRGGGPELQGGSLEDGRCSCGKAGCEDQSVALEPEKTATAIPTGPAATRSIMVWAPSTDEQACTRSQEEHAQRHGAKAKPPGEVGQWKGRLGISVLDVHRGGGAGINEIEQNGWEPMPRPLVVDSGAGETVLPENWCKAYALEKSPGSEANDFYTTADGTPVYNQGQKKLLLSTLDGRSVRKMTFQVAKVSKALGSVSQMVDGGNRVTFDVDAQGRDISCIENKQSGERIWLRRENGVYVLDMLVGPPSQANDQTNSPGFARQGPR